MSEPFDAKTFWSQFSQPAGTGPDDPLTVTARYAPVDWKAAWQVQADHTDWLIKPVIETGTVNVLFARPATGKSLLALEMSLKLVREGRTVLYLDEENRVTDLVERLQAFGVAEPGELDRLRLYSFPGLPPLDTAEGGRHLVALAAAAEADLVVLDTTSRMVQGRENDSDTYIQLYRCSLVPLKQRGIAVLRLDHPGKDESRGQRGSSAKDGDADSVWRLTEETQGLRYKLVRVKSRSGHGDVTALDVHRRYAPLRHEWTVPDAALEKTALRTACAQLSSLNVPPSAGRDRCRTALNEAGIPIGNALLSDLVRHRKQGCTCPGQ